MEKRRQEYRGRIAPTPTGLMHLGHARTFSVAQQRAKVAGGKLFLRIEDLDQARCKEEFVDALIEDLSWAGLKWEDEVLRQSQRLSLFREVWKRLRAKGAIYPCACSRKDVAEAVTAPHGEGGELIYPGTCRDTQWSFESEEAALAINWRFRVPDGETIAFEDGRLGRRSYVAGKDFGDFLVWRKDGFPSYELAVVADDCAQGITEVVRGEDLLVSTARQLLLYKALEEPPPEFYHCPLILDTGGNRLAKRAGSLGLRELRKRGVAADQLFDEKSPT